MKAASLLLTLLICLPLHAASADTTALAEWRAGSTVTPEAVAAYGEERCFRADPIPDAIFRRMQGKSFKTNPHIQRSDLRYLRCLHTDAKGHILLGEMVCNKKIATVLTHIFRELYQHQYPIERMVLIDDYDAEDEQSMRHNNSSCFCYRTVSGSKHLSKHATGMAVDLNTLYNPYMRRRSDGSLYVQPSTARLYCNRNKRYAYTIVEGDLCHRLFLKHGFRWGGAWKNTKDWQHFEK